MEYAENIDFKQITIGKVLGYGSYGMVYKGVLGESKKVAIKKFFKKGEIENEIQHLARVQHPNIIKLFGITSDKEHNYLIMEYAENGSLHHRIYNNQEYSIRQALDWALQCAEGVAYLHSQTPPILHRDLKPVNLLLTDHERQLKICDFGLVTTQQSITMTAERGTLCYMAPEVFEGKRYNMKCDVFSWGTILWELLSKKRLSNFSNGYANQMRISKGDRPELPSDWPEAIKKLITSCLAQDPENRDSMDKVVSQIRTINGSEKFELESKLRPPLSATYSDTVKPQSVERHQLSPTTPGVSFVRPPTQIELLPNHGFTASIPDKPGIELFAFHGKLNEEMNNLEAGTWSVDIIKAKDGLWTYTNNDVQLTSGDKIFYWTMIHHNGIGYREDDGIFEVNGPV